MRSPCSAPTQLSWLVKLLTAPPASDATPLHPSPLIPSSRPPLIPSSRPKEKLFKAHGSVNLPLMYHLQWPPAPSPPQHSPPHTSHEPRLIATSGRRPKGQLWACLVGCAQQDLPPPLHLQLGPAGDHHSPVRPPPPQSHPQRGRRCRKVSASSPPPPHSRDLAECPRA
jgi:hypothetical protein